MGVTKATLIAVGTFGGLGAVLAYSPPHHSLNLGGSLTGAAAGSSFGKTVPSQSAAPTESSSATPINTPASSTPSPSETQKPSPSPKVTHTSVATVPTHAPKPTKTTAKPPAPKKSVAPQKSLVNGTFVGATSKTVYGPVQVQVVIKDSKIIDVTALQLPSAQPYDIQLDQQAVPILVSQTLAAQSADIQGVSGASYTSQGWYDSLVTALAKSGI